MYTKFTDKNIKLHIVTDIKGSKMKADMIDDRPIHRLVQIPSILSCVYCRKNKLCRYTEYKCSSCGNALCKDCFLKYHDKIRKYIRIL